MLPGRPVGSLKDCAIAVVAELTTDEAALATDETVEAAKSAKSRNQVGVCISSDLLVC